ncbi:hypothetical protein SERLA73DRAFT_72881 [Serpula lacrymans var. lacrymans S7.3]|uniref:Major facilitator superfamily (MFS) profile domain-containing protein n=2 Tax=Serpula lacrymans var. lacrymans TaxID=341189 RepID=F8PVD3_SERL3|nr:uncharacterized protein SERLADRAFT_437429 [Serpula lacrymans var. lacrymans S7.9]EGO00143.1 hypothetical protein SERLA73DRAFT_72881 [Serpula lacrymans var. lacrymans S7.3]EGO25705.1 hypothetical protein SERLADRAFT_437429 [Serpula lacrymans var. lacrymans S7.9]
MKHTCVWIYRGANAVEDGPSLYAVSTALPTIVTELHSNQFVWVATSYGLASTALLPLSGGLAEIFGRRPIVLVSLVLFALGSALGGAAQSMNMLIAARTIQGSGAGGIFTLSQIILSDMVTLKERGTYSGLFGLTWALGGGIGPLVGGALAQPSRWRWLFYLNIPIAGLAFLLVLLFLSLPTPVGTLKEKMARIDWIGNFIIIGATCACVIGLTWGGVVYPWNTAQVLVPICLGFAGLIVFFLFEGLWCQTPLVPWNLLSNRTNLSGYIQISLGAFINISILYYMPVYYQACKGASPIASGVDLFGLSFSTAPFSIFAGLSVRATKRYRPQLWFAWCCILLGLGLLTTIDENTAQAKSIGYQVIIGIGVGIVFSGTYFPVLAPLPVTSNAYALSFFVFVRTLTQVWAVTIEGAVLQNELQKRTPVTLFHGTQSAQSTDIAYSIIPLIPQLPPATKAVVRQAFAVSLVLLWKVLIVVAGVGLLSSLLMKGLPLHTQKDEKWALQERQSEREDGENVEADREGGQLI